MNIGGTSLQAPAYAAMGALKSSLETQASVAGQIVANGTGANPQMAQAAAAEQGKGQNLDMSV